MKSEQRDGMQIDWDAPIAMDDGVVLRADVFRPIGGGQYPVILSYGPYAKGLAFQEGYKGNWERLTEAAPEVLEGSSNKYQVWELVDPEKWVPDGYVCVRVDSRGAGRSPGVIDIWSPREARDIYDCIEWAGTQPWSNGKVGMNGISYFATNQWQVGALQAAASRRALHLGGLRRLLPRIRPPRRHLSGFPASWYARQVLRVQHGVGERGLRSRVTGEPVAGPETLPAEELAKNRADAPGEVARRRLIDDCYRARMVAFEKIEVPLLSAGNWGGVGLHPRGNFEGYLRAGSEQKWLEVHGDTHFTHFYSNYGDGAAEALLRPLPQGRGHRLGAAAAASRSTSAVPASNSRCAARPNGRSRARSGPNTTCSRTDMRSAPDAPAHATTLRYETTGDGLTFLTPPMTEELEITGPVAAKLWLSSDTTDADVFLVLRVFDPDGKEVTFIGSNDPRTPVGLGWLRASHRKLDPRRDAALPALAHPRRGMAARARQAGRARRRDLADLDRGAARLPARPHRARQGLRGRRQRCRRRQRAYPMKGVGPFTHTDPHDRPPEIFGGTNTLHFAAGKMPYLLLPIIPQA